MSSASSSAPTETKQVPVKDPREHGFAGDEVRRLAVVMPEDLASCVLATPALRALREACPRAEVVGWIDERWLPVLAGAVGVDRWEACAGGWSAWSIFKRASALRRGGFDAALALNDKTACAAALARAKVGRRVGYASGVRAWLLTDRLVPRRSGRRRLDVPAVDRCLQAARFLGAAGDDAAVRLAVDTASQRRAESRWGQPRAQDPVRVLLHAPASSGVPPWLEAVADRCLGESEARVAWLLADRQAGDAVRGETLDGVLEDGALLKATLAQADVVVTADSAVRCIATAVGAGVVSWRPREAEASRTSVHEPLGTARERVVVAEAPPDAERDADAVFAAIADLLADVEGDEVDAYAAQHALLPSDGLAEEFGV